MKKIFSLLIVLSLCFALTACGSDSEQTDSKGNEVTTSKSAAKEDKKESKEEKKESKESGDATTEAAASDGSGETTEVATEKAEDSSDPQPTGNSITVYNDDGVEVTLLENSDGTYSTNDGVLYYMGEDKVFRARGHEDLHLIVAIEEEEGTYEEQLSKTTITVFSGDGGEVSVTHNNDDTWSTNDGIVYYMGDDGILRAKGYEDLYTERPVYEETDEDDDEEVELENQSLGESMTVYYEDGTEETVTNNVDEGTWVTNSGTVYYMGDDGVLRAKGAPDLYTTNPAAE